jgi:cell division protein FtsB
MSARGRCISSRNLGQFLLTPVRAKVLRKAAPRRSRSSVGLGEDLERRIVLTAVGGGNLLGSALNAIGVVTAPILAPPSTTSSGSGQTSQLQKDVQALQTELASLAAKSGVTVADLTSLAADSQALIQGGKIDVKSLNAAVDELATAIAGGTSTTQAQTDFAAVFASTTVTQATVTQAFTDLSTTITDSAVTSTDLSTVAADQAAIQSDLPTNPWGPPIGGGGPPIWGGGPPVGGPIGPIIAGFGGAPGGPIVIGLPGPAPAPGVLAGALSSIGVVTGPVLASSGTTPTPWGWGGSSGQTSQLQTDVQALQTELASLAAKSGVTVADLTSLAADSQPERGSGRAGHGDRRRDVDDAGADGLRGGIRQHDGDAGDGRAGVHRPEQGDHGLGGDQHRPLHRRRRSGRHPERPVQPSGRERPLWQSRHVVGRRLHGRRLPRQRERQ